MSRGPSGELLAAFRDTWRPIATVANELREKFEAFAAEDTRLSAGDLFAESFWSLVRAGELAYRARDGLRPAAARRATGPERSAAREVFSGVVVGDQGSEPSSVGFAFAQQAPAPEGRLTALTRELYEKACSCDAGGECRNRTDGRKRLCWTCWSNRKDGRPCRHEKEETLDETP